MIDATRDSLSPEPVRWVGNEAVLLDRDRCVRLVESGSIALFCVDVRRGAPAGPRRLLQRIGSGQAVFSVPNKPGLRLGFVIVPIKEAVIREVPLEDLWAERATNGASADTLIEEWVGLLARLVKSDEKPKLPVRVAGNRDLDLEEEQTLSPERKAVVWVQVLEGVVHLMGSADMTLPPESGWFPLDSSMWIRAAGRARVATRTTAALEEPAAMERGLSDLQGHVLRRLRADVDRESELEKVRLRERDRIQEGRKAEALSEVAAVLEPRVVPIRGDSPLLRALSAVGRTLGVEIRPPMKSESSGAAGEAVEAIARASRIRVRPITLTGKWWGQDCGSFLAFTADEERRPIAVIRKRSLRYEAYDPVDETRTRVTKRIAARLSPDAWVLYRPLPEGKLKLFDLFRFSVAGRSTEFALAALTGVLATLLGMITPQATAVLMDDAIPDADRRLLAEIGAGLLAAAFGQIVFHLAQGFVLLRLGTASGAVGQAAVWDRLLRLRPSFFRRFSSGDLQSRVMAVSDVGGQLSGLALTSMFSGFLALLNLLLLYYYSPTLSALAVAIGAVVMVFIATVGFFVRKNVRELVELDGKLFGVVVQLVNGVAKLRVAGAGDRAYIHWLKKYGATLKLWAGAYGLKDRVYLFNQILPTLSTALLFFFAHGLLMEGRQASVSGGISLGTFLAFSVAFGTFLAGIVSLSNAAVTLLDVFAKGRRVRPILEEEPETNESKADPGQLTGRLAMSGVQFRYGDDSPLILNGIDIRAEPGEFVALVGPSGSGKSTTMRLLLGFESPSAGTVTFDGQDLANLDVIAIRRQIGVVLQGGRLDAGSIFENIACGSVISLDDAWAAVEDAGFAEDVRQMPMGMHTMVSVGGSNLSGGQRQRLLIARSLAQRPRILLFDEATSALDNRTQLIVSESLERLNVTRVVIAHRLSTIRGADRIYVIQDGMTVQEGRFDELMSNDESLFARMMRRQLT